MLIIKIIISNFVICIFFTGNLQYSQALSDITYEAGTQVDIQTGADVCANDIFINGTFAGGGTICTGALPVSLSSFTCSIDKRSVTLMWVTEWELNNSGFEIERAFFKADGSSDEWGKITFIPGKGTSNISNGYMFSDEKLKTGKYKYRLKQINYTGNYEYYQLNDEVNITPPGKFELGQNFPNPGNPNTKINFELPVESKVTIKLYDILGKEIKTLMDELKKADYYTVEIKGTALASGVYFYRILAEGEGLKFTKTLKMVLIK